MNELLLVVTIAGRQVALRSTELHSVIELETLTPVPRAPAHVAGLTALRSRILTVIDCRSYLGVAADEADALGRHAAVVEVEGHVYALMVDEVADVTPALSEVTAPRTRLGAGWANAAHGMVETALGPLLLIDVGRMVSGAEPAIAA